MPMYFSKIKQETPWILFKVKILLQSDNYIVHVELKHLSERMQ